MAVPQAIVGEETTSQLAQHVVEELQDFAAVPASAVPADARDNVEAVEEAIADSLDTCRDGLRGPCVAALSMIAAARQTVRMSLVSRNRATRRLVRLFEDTRVIRTGTRTDIAGAEINFDLSLQGLRGRDVLVTWAVYQKRHKRRISPAWLMNTALRLRAKSDDDQASQQLFIPLPRKSGDYYVRLDAWVGRTRIAFKRAGFRLG